MMVELELGSDPAGLDSSALERLLSARPRNIFSTGTWLRVWWEEFGVGKDLRILSIRRGDELAGVVPLYAKEEDGERVLRFVGGIDLTDYIDPICGPADRAMVAEALVDWLARTDDWTVFDAHNLAVPAQFAEHLVERADASGMPFQLEQEETSAVVLLPPTWEAYLASLPGKERHELRRKVRRLERDHPDATVRATSAETLDADLQTFFDMHRGAEGLKGHFMRREIATFFTRVAHAFMPLGILRLDFLEIAGTPIASTFGFELDGVYYLYNSAYEPEHARLSPGVVLCARLLHAAIEKGLTRFDFLRGPERYKYRFGAQPLPLHNVRITRP